MFDTPEWVGATGFYYYDLRSPPDRNESKVWEPICVWAAPTYTLTTMPVTFQASTGTLAPPADRRYLLELLSIPSGVSGAPPVGTVWELPLLGQRTIVLPTYRTTDGLTGYRFSFTMTEAEPGPGDFDNDSDVDVDDCEIFAGCLTGPGGVPDPGCTSIAFERCDLNDDNYVDLTDFSLFTLSFTGLLASRPEYVGAATCLECHEEYHAKWSQTLHAGAFNTLVEDGEADNRACYPCHTVAFGHSSGFVSIEATPHLAGVQCETCHGSGSDHNADPVNVPLTVDLDSKLCGQCHVSCHGMCGDYYHPHYEQWSTSKHSTALADIRWSADYEQSCLSCHSTDYRLAPANGKPLASQVKYSLECAACHAPYGSVNAHQLRLPPENLCAQCHTMGDAGPGDVPEQPAFEFLHGLGGFTLDGTPLDGLYPAPFMNVEGECVFCHVYREAYAGPDQPANSGHTFEANTRACTPCHTEADAVDRIARVYAEIEFRLANVGLYFDPDDPSYVDPATLTPEQLEQYIIAKFNHAFVQADGTYGAHNSFFARRLLEEAETFFGIAP